MSLRQTLSSSVGYEGQVKYLIFTEVPSDKVDEFVNDESKISKCDVIALLYDNDRDHLEYLRQ